MTFEGIAEIAKDLFDSFPTEIVSCDDVRSVNEVSNGTVGESIKKRQRDTQAV